MPSQKSHDNFQKQGMVTVNHMNHDIAGSKRLRPPNVARLFPPQERAWVPGKKFSDPIQFIAKKFCYGHIFGTESEPQ